MTTKPSIKDNGFWWPAVDGVRVPPSLITIGGITEGTFCAVSHWNDDRWLVRRVTTDYSADEALVAWIADDWDLNLKRLAYPIDPRMKREDIDGATIIAPNADNTGWLFYFCDQDFHRDFESSLRASVLAEFVDAIDDAEKKRDEAAGTAAGVDAQNRYAAIKRFRRRVKDAVIADARTKPLGYYQRHPHEGHVHVPIAAQATKLATAWQADERDDWLLIGRTVTGIIKSLTTRLPVYKARWEIEAEQSDDDQGNGNGG